MFSGRICNQYVLSEIHQESLQTEGKQWQIIVKKKPNKTNKTKQKKGGENGLQRKGKSVSNSKLILMVRSMLIRLFIDIELKYMI